MSETPISEREIEFAMAMFAATNPARFEHLCKAIRTLERELNEWKACAEELAKELNIWFEPLPEGMFHPDNPIGQKSLSLTAFNKLKEKSK